MMTEKNGYSTIDEIINDILQILSLEYQEKIKEMSPDDFRTIEHFNFGQNIRNKYYHQNPAKEQLLESLDDQVDYLVLGGDEFSDIIMEKLYQRITTSKK
jgi:hypothetical protein